LAFDHDTGKEVAWNSVKTASMSTREKERILEEIKLYQQLDHPNILKMIKAWRNKAKDEVVMITELMSGSLKEYIHRNAERPRLKVIKLWCRSILKALEYFHSRNPPVIHRDLKCDNIFISSSNSEIRIGDLGFSTTLRESHLKSQVGTPYFMAPEMYEEKYGAGVDIYSFGLCVIEMCTLSTPYSECRNQAALLQKHKNKEKPESFHLIQDELVKDFINLCILPADQRPSAKDLLDHPLLASHEEDESNEPVFVSVQEKHQEGKREILEIITEDLQEDTINVVLLVQNPDTSRFNIEFKFNLNQDVPEQIVEDLIRKIDPSEETLPILLEALESKILKKEEKSLPQMETPRFSLKRNEKVYNLSIRLGIQDTGNYRNLKIDFLYDSEKDSAEGITEEIIQKLELDPEDFHRILNVVNSKINEVVAPPLISYTDLLDMNLEIPCVPIKQFGSTTESVNSEVKSLSSSKGSGVEVFIKAHYFHKDDPFSGTLSPINSFMDHKFSPCKSDDEEAPKCHEFRISSSLAGPVQGFKIRKAKKALSKLLLLQLKMNETYDSETEKAVKIFQNARGLTSDGVLTHLVFDLIMSNSYSDAYECMKKRP
jgi:WNK lysine deficient protein kinase